MLARLNRFHGLNSLTFAYRKGETVRSPQLSLKYVLNTRRERYRAAVVVSRKVDKSAVVRNRIRRRVYEAVRQQAEAIQGPYDLVFTAFSNQLADMDAKQLRQIVAGQLREAGVIQGQNRGSHAIVKQAKRVESE